jgi:1,4-dihydroxy-2-naphthoate octaprenyltransferase
MKFPKRFMTVLFHLARLRPLMSWSGVSIIIGVAIAVQQIGYQNVDWLLTALAAIVCIGLQYVAHPINDIVDYPVDVKANIEGTGRHKTLISGLSTKKELMSISFIMVLALFAATLFILTSRPTAILFGIVGFAALWMYNAPPFKLSYHPFSEAIISFPVNASMVLGMCVVACNQITPLAIYIALVQGFLAATMLAAYFAMDVNSDSIGGKNSTTVKYPLFHWGTILAGAGLVYASIVWVRWYMGINPLLMVIPTIFMIAMFYLAFDVDNTRIRTYIKYGYGEDAHAKWAKAGTDMRGVLVKEMNLIYLHAVLFAVALLVLGT